MSFASGDLAPLAARARAAGLGRLEQNVRAADVVLSDEQYALLARGVAE